EAIDKYVTWAKNRSERERQSEVKNITGEFTGTYCINPFTGEEIPIWVADYVLAGYGSGAIMAVPAHDSRDYAFAKHFDLPIVQVVSGGDISEESYDAKEGIMMNSGFLDGMDVKEAISFTIKKIEEMEIGFGTINYRLRDAIFSRQRYWGEPFPVYYKEGIPYTLSEDKLPLLLPEVDKYLPTETGEPPLARAKDWVTEEGYPLETNTMPGFAGSSAYYLRYMDPHNNEEYFSKEANEYWKSVDLYIGGDEHAAGHLIYSRFWNKFLFDIGWVCKDEPFKKLINQGMIQGRSNFVYRINYIDVINDNKKLLAQLIQYFTLSYGVDFKKNDKNIELKSFKQLYYSEYDFYYNNDFKLIITNRKQIGRLLKIKRKLGKQILKDHKILILSNEEIINGFGKCLKEIKRGCQLKFDKFDIENLKNVFVSNNYKNKFDVTPIHVDVNIVHNDLLDLESFKNGNPEYKNAEFILEDGKYICGYAVEKMSKSLYNVVNPDDIIEQYGADTLRMYEMFLGPLEMSKPWDTNGIDGVHKFLRKFWRLFHDDQTKFDISDENPTNDELKVLHKTIKKIQEDIERFSFNTSVSAFMICVNELNDLKCNKRKILEPLIILLSPFAPHITEELWQICDNSGSISYAEFPEYEEKYLVESTFEYPVSFNGKMRFKIKLSMDIGAKDAEEQVLSHELAQKWLDSKTPRKVIFVPKKIINVVI
ncbi:MAG: leucine--tRNA ligase, partial [Bacteroidales bacterium]|nr:leucine--tRNA ligase [Bacteroidales bacterium]